MKFLRKYLTRLYFIINITRNPITAGFAGGHGPIVIIETIINKTAVLQCWIRPDFSMNKAMKYFLHGE